MIIYITTNPADKRGLGLHGISNVFLPEELHELASRIVDDNETLHVLCFDSVRLNEEQMAILMDISTKMAIFTITEPYRLFERRKTL